MAHGKNRENRYEDHNNQNAEKRSLRTARSELREEYMRGTGRSLLIEAKKRGARRQARIELATETRNFTYETYVSEEFEPPRTEVIYFSEYKRKLQKKAVTESFEKAIYGRTQRKAEALRHAYA